MAYTRFTASKSTRRGGGRVSRDPSKRAAPGFIWPAAIVLAGLIAYGNCFRGEFLMDDYLSIVTNDVIRHLWPLGAFVRDTRPVTDFTFALNYAVSGISLVSFHAVNLFIHLATGLLLFGVARRTLLSPRLAESPKTSARLAFAIAVLWVVHPLTTQAVTYIVQRAESLMAFFYLATLYGVIRGASARRPAGWYLLAVVACALGMGTKAVMVTAPLVVLLYDWWFLGRSIRGAIRARWPLYVALVCTIPILWFVGVIGGLYLKEQGGPITVGFAMKGLTPAQYGLTQLGVVTHYLRLVLWPYPLVIDYGWPIAREVREVLPGALVISVLVGLMLWLLLRRNAAAFPLAAFLIVLAPTSSIVPIRDIAFEHRMYLPLAAIIALIVVGINRLMHRIESQRRGLRGLAPGALVIAIVGLAVTTHMRNRAYADPVSLWSKNVALTPRNPRPINALGYALFKAGKNDEAVARFREVLQLDPYYAGAYANLGQVYFSEHRLADAIKQYQKALEISPEEFGPDFYSPYGIALLETNQVGEAIKILGSAVQMDPDFVDARYNLANAHLKQGDSRRAAQEYEEVVRRAPGFAEAYVNLGLAKARMGDFDAAIEAYDRALRVGTSPDARFKALYNMGLALGRMGKKPQAIEQLRNALKLKPDHPGALSALNSLQSAPP